MDKEWTLLVILMSSFHMCTLRAVAESTCKPAEEGQAYSLQCDVQLSGLPVTWQIGESDSIDDVYCQCYGDPAQSNQQICECYKPGVSATNSVTGNILTSTFTINSPNRSQRGTRWTCRANVQDIKTCDFLVYARAKNVTCGVQEPEPTSNTSVTVRCQTEDIFPATACLFYKKTNNMRTNLTAGANGVTVETGDKECTLRVSGTYLGREDHQFGVVMYPDVTGSGTDINYGKTSPDTRIIKIGNPSVELTNCPTVGSDGSVNTDYIKEGTTGKCTCTRTDDSYFPVDINWKDNTVSSRSQQSATLTFPVVRNQTFTCSATNSLQWTKEIIYRPQVAYGPSSIDVTLEPPDQEHVDLCHDSVTFTVQCKVSSPGVVPGATFSYTVSPAASGSVVPQMSSDGSAGLATVTVTQTGTHGITCLANNSKFEEVHTQNTLSLIVREPPSAPTIEIIQTSNVSPTKGDMLTVEEGEATIKCRAIGEYPPQVTEFRLSCGEDKTITNTGNQAEMSVSFTRAMNGQPCSCTATYDSSCYRSNTTLHPLNVLYPPSVLTFSVNGNPSTATVEENSTIKFDCNAQGNPGPGLSLQHAGRGELKNVTSGDTIMTTLTHNLTMKCLDTGVYNCTAQSRGMEDSSTVEVYVLCPQKLERAESSNAVYEGEVNGTLSLNVTVYGHPDPTVFQLHGHKEKVREDDYDITYSETRPPYGRVTLMIFHLKEEYFQNYTLNITNTKGSLVYDFMVSGYIGSSGDLGSEEQNIAAIAGGIAAALLVIIIIVLVIFIVRRRGLSCGKKQASSRKSGDDEVEHVITNDLYSPGANSGEVVIDNSDLYSGNWNRKSNEVVIDNSDLYSGNWKQESNEVVVDNSALYGKSDDFKATRDALYRNYADVTTSITSATAAPVRDMKTSNGAKQGGGNNSYEDVEVGAKPSGPSVQPKPKVAVKPMTAAKPTPAPKPSGPPTSGPQGAFAVQNDGGDQLYASVIRTGKPQAPRTQPANERESDFFPDQSKKPEVPEKKYEQEETQTGQEGRKKEQKKSSADKKNKNKKADEIPVVSQGGAAASSSHDNPYVNGGFTEDDGNVYANAGGAKAAPNSSDNIKSIEELNTGRFRNKDGLVYTTVELMPQPTGQRKPKVVEDKVNYSQITF